MNKKDVLWQEFKHQQRIGNYLLLILKNVIIGISTKVFMKKPLMPQQLRRILGMSFHQMINGTHV